MEDNTIEVPSQRRAVELWVKRVKNAKKRWKDDFDRMRENMDFVAGFQWAQQDKMRWSKYVCNMTIQMVNHKVATLYAKNPTVAAQQRRRLLYSVWDESLQSLENAVMRAQQSMLSGLPDLEAQAIINDYQQGRMHKQVVDKVARTLEVAYQHQIDTQTPEFKEQMKQLVTTAVVCGVAYVRLCYHRQGPYVPQEPPGRTMKERMGAAQEIITRIQNGEINEDSPEAEQLRMLVSNLGYAQSETADIEEGLRFEFPDPTSIIPDPKVKSLPEFLGARWVAQEYALPLSEVNAFFGTDIKKTSEMVTYASDGLEVKDVSDHQDYKDEPCVLLWEIMDYTSRKHFFIIDGHKDYVQPPEPMTPNVRRFWTLFPLTFNRVVNDGSKDLKSSVYPPSDVDLAFHAQKEWNQTRNALRAQRRANSPKYMARKGLLTDNDKAALDTVEPNQVVELESLPADAEPGKYLAPMQHAPIDPMAYDINPIREDFMLATRMQEANMGSAQPDVTATVGTIAEQSRQTVASSNVDDLDGLLSRLAEAGGETLIREMSVETIKRIVGPGAVWPEQNREDFINEVYLQIQAASSGRPNKALESAQFERLAPLLFQAGANPVFMVKEAVKRLDDRLDVNEAFPLIPTGSMAQEGPPGEASEDQSSGGPAQPLQSIPSEAPVALAGHMQ